MALGRQMNIIECIVTSDVSKEKNVFGGHTQLIDDSPLEQNKSDFIFDRAQSIINYTDTIMILGGIEQKDIGTWFFTWLA